jgi:antitoxin ParD1/3/4
MPTRNVSLTEELDRFITSGVQTGRYENASDVVRAAFRSLEINEEEQKEQKEKMEYLRRAIAKGDASGTAPGAFFARVRRKTGLPSEKL